MSIGQSLALRRLIQQCRMLQQASYALVFGGALCRCEARNAATAPVAAEGRSATHHARPAFSTDVGSGKVFGGTCCAGIEVDRRASRGTASMGSTRGGPVPSNTMTKAEPLLAERERHVPRGVLTPHPLVIARGEGAHAFDADGKSYLDFVGGIGVMNVGHNHPRMVKAVSEQLSAITHTDFQVAAA